MIEQLWNNSMIGMLQVDIEGEILFVNNTCRSILEEENNKLKGKKINLLLPQSNIIRAIKKQKMQVSVHEASKQTLIEIPDRDGRLGTILMFGKKNLEVLNSFSNKTSELIQEMEALMNLTGELVTITDAEGEILKVSARCESIMGVKEHDFVGKSVFSLQEQGVLSFSSTAKVIKEKRVVTLTQETKNGKRLFVRGYPIFDEHGQLKKVINISKDITEEESLKKSLDESRKLVSYYQSELNNLQSNETEFVIKTKEMREVYNLASRVADVTATVLILGESGVGKDVVARLIHRCSSRRKQPFIKVNCGAIPEGLIESELFGYTKGAFTGASKSGKKGLFLEANKGTLFLDEIGELPLNLQVKLLQVLQDRKVTPLGETTATAIDVRIVAATNRDLKAMVDAGEFRKDLYYRLNVVPITIPPLRERKDDIPFLVNHFLEVFNKQYNKSKMISNEAMQLLLQQKWEGNIRELENTIERLVVTIPDNTITVFHLRGLNKGINEEEFSDLSLKEMVDLYEKKVLINTLENSKSMKETSEKLRVDLSTISRKIKKHKINIAKLQTRLQNRN